MRRTLARKARTLFRQPRFTLLWLLPLWLLLGLSKAAILSVSFKRLAGHLGRPMDAATAADTPGPVLACAQRDRARQIGRAVRLAARHTPWDSNCFPQAIAARALLGLYRIPHVMYFGLGRDARSARMTAHAWVMAGPEHVTGGAGELRYTVVGAFAAPGGQRA